MNAKGYEKLASHILIDAARRIEHLILSPYREYVFFGVEALLWFRSSAAVPFFEMVDREQDEAVANLPMDEARQVARRYVRRNRRYFITMYVQLGRHLLRTRGEEPAYPRVLRYANARYRTVLQLLELPYEDPHEAASLARNGGGHNGRVAVPAKPAHSQG